MTKLFNEKLAFNQTNEVYVGTWFGHDIWLYDDHHHGVGSLLAVHGNEPGNYATWVGDDHWFQHGATIGTSNGPVLLADYLTTHPMKKAFLMGFAALWARGDRPQAPVETEPTITELAHKVMDLRTATLLSPACDNKSENARQYFMLAQAALATAASYLMLSENS